ncbi:HXXEE domain-containing protein [Necropsobacter rosorum]|uniref:HXXEE domain-containing protein n=1 Tax=Necropsobacter rosorum TaxID=908285 RepID=UPI0006916006
MKFLLNNWVNLSGVIGVAILGFTFATWHDWHVLQIIALLNLAVIFFHFFEEFGFPGGFPKFANTIFAPKDSTPDIADRYPLNNMSALWINWGTALVMYLPPVIFYDQIWLGLVGIIFGGVAQVIIHGIVNNNMLKTKYNSGLASSLLGHFPLMIAYIYVIETQNLVVWWEYVLAVFLMIAWYVGVIRILIPKLWEDKNSPYAFAPYQMEKFDRFYGEK